MKYFTFMFLPLLVLLSGCTKEEEPVSAVEASEPVGIADVQPDPVAPTAPVVAAEETISEQVTESVKTMASSLDWSAFSWEKVADVPYSDKEQLLGWANTQVDGWKDKLAKAAMSKGTGLLAGLGDSGWQGSLKQVVSTLEQVRESSPETWELARGALISAWDTFEKEATKYLGEG